MVGDAEGFPLLAPGGASKGLKDTDPFLGSVGYVGDMVGKGEPGVECDTQHPGGLIERESGA